MAHKSAGTSALARHLRVLDAFDPLHPFLTLTEICRAAGLAPSTAHRLVGELVREGLLERQDDRTYRLGVRLWEYASRTPGAIGLREAARPWIDAVHRRVRQHTQLGILQGTDVLFLERVSWPDAVVNATIIGGRVPAHVSSAGLVLLAHAPEGVVDAVVAKPMRKITPRTISSPDALRRILEEIRRDGFVVADGFIHEQTRGIAVPLRGAAGEVVAALGVVVPNDDSPSRPLADLLTAAAVGAARDVSRVTGHAHDVAPEALGVSPRSLAYIAELEREARADGR